MTTGQWIVVVIVVPESMATSLTPYGPYSEQEAREVRDKIADALNKAELAGGVTVHELLTYSLEFAP